MTAVRSLFLDIVIAIFGPNINNADPWYISLTLKDLTKPKLNFSLFLHFISECKNGDSPQNN